MSSPESPRPAWREPMVWLVFGIPLATVIAGISTVIIAAGGTGMERAPGVRVTAQIQVDQPASTEAAARR
jgi:uncharacterized protein